jgi:aspartate racemase
MEKGIIGIVGGMGPMAGISLSENIIRHTIARKDQDHLPQILFSIPSEITDRTDYLTGKVKTNPGFRIARILSDMESAGVTIAAIACNSAHALPIFDLIVSELEQRKSKISLLHIIQEVGSFISAHYRDKKKVGILGTTGTYLTRQFDLLNRVDLETINISETQQHQLHKAIYHRNYGIKSSTGAIPRKAVEITKNAAGSLLNAGAEILVLGCTELSLVFKEHHFQNLPVIDSSVVLARALIRMHSPEKLRPWQT